jgi:hypothetical protein
MEAKGLIPWDQACESDSRLTEFAEEEAELEEEERREEREAELQRAIDPPPRIHQRLRIQPGPRSSQRPAVPAEDEEGLPDDCQVPLDATQFEGRLESDNTYVLTLIAPS